MAAVFDLTSNPFYILNLTVRAKRDEIATAFEDVLSEGEIDEAVLNRAQQAILTPKSRVDAEISWLLNLAPQTARRIIDAALTKNWPAVNEALSDLDGIDLANLSADLCCRHRGSIVYVEALLDAHENLSEAEVTKQLMALRKVSGFPSPTETIVEQSISRLRAIHAKAAMSNIAALKNPSNALVEIVEGFQTEQPRSTQFLNSIIREYSTWSEPLLNKLTEEIETQIAECRKTTQKTYISQIIKKLSDWDEISQPVQLADLAKGHEDPRSKTVYHIIREFALWLANEKQEFEHALRLCKTLREKFAELPLLLAQIDEDVETLEGLSKDKIELDQMRPLLDAREKVTKQFEQLNRDLNKGGFSTKSIGLAKLLFASFEIALGGSLDTESQDLPWDIVRSIAIEMHNDKDLDDGALQLIEGLLQYSSKHPSHIIKAKLNVDEKTLKRTAMWKRIASSPEDTHTNLQIVNDLITDAEPDEWKTLQDAKNVLENRKSQQRSRLYFWGFVGVVVVAIALANQTKGPSSKRYSSTTNSVNNANSVGVNTVTEIVPPVGTNLALSLEQIRYCLFQGARLDSLNGMISDTSSREIDGFNLLIKDFNSRCARAC